MPYGKRKYSNGYMPRKRYRAPVRKKTVYSRAAAKSLVLNLREQKMDNFNFTPNDILTGVSPTATFRSFRVAQGDSSGQRDGNEIYGTGIYSKFQITANNTVPNKAYVRCLLLTPKLDPDDQPIVASMTSAIDTDKFHIHKDFMVSVCNDATLGDNKEQSLYVTIKKKWKKPIRVTYGGGTTPIMATPCIYLVSQPSVAQAPPRLTTGSMFNWFKDR